MDDPVKTHMNRKTDGAKSLMAILERRHDKKVSGNESRDTFPRSMGDRNSANSGHSGGLDGHGQSEYSTAGQDMDESDLPEGAEDVAADAMAAFHSKDHKALARALHNHQSLYGKHMELHRSQPADDEETHE